MKSFEAKSIRCPFCGSMQRVIEGTIRCHFRDNENKVCRGSDFPAPDFKLIERGGAAV